MLVVFAGSWWSLVLRGIAAILFGVLAFTWPHITLTALVFLFGFYALADGIFAIAAGVKSHGENKRWWVLLVEGIFSVIAGVVAFLMPGITALILLVLIAAWAMVTGLFEIASLLFGVALLIYPSAGALAVVWLIGIYSIVFGVLLVGLGLRLRGLVRSTQKMSPSPV